MYARPLRVGRLVSDGVGYAGGMNPSYGVKMNGM